MNMEETHYSDLEFLKSKDSVLYVNNIYYRDVIKDSTEAVLLMNRSRISSNCNYLKNILHKVTDNNSLICYALKVAPSTEVLKSIKECGVGVEVYCEKELDMAIEQSIQPIVVDGMYKPKEFLFKSVENEVFLINADSIREIYLINEIAQKLNKNQNIGIRVKYSKESKMGINIESLLKEIDSIKKLKNVNLIGVHTHPGSNVTDKNRLNAHYKKLKEAYIVLKEKGFNIKIVDFGGGLAEKIIAKDNLEETLTNLFKMFDSDPNITFILEPGRFLVSDAGILFAKVHDVRDSENTIILNIAVAPYFLNTYSNFIYLLPDNMEFIEKRNWKICGIWPTDMDYIKEENLKNGLPNQIKIGDYFCFLNAGAYNIDRLGEYTLSEEIDVLYI
ncbi:alanine racemase [Clostridium sp. CS001]|uniref:diaminopimelate decarboxylase family protein n=1 Tax=Clostridium sp. CS001 TaxID=2880648 RepID=UPI001CF33046|nr:alanine racemase [Clostridium sp. CS001]MCB2289467.1 alanine racemase [Clostridium sp. CS001]